MGGTQALELRQAGDDKERYAWIASVLRRFNYGGLKKRPDRGVVLMYLQRLSGYSRARVKRLVARWQGGKSLVKRYRAPEHAFTRRYTAADVALDKLASLPEAATFLRVDTTLKQLQALARALTDVQAAEELNEARHTLFKRVLPRSPHGMPRANRG